MGLICPLMTIGTIGTGDYVACKGEDCAMWDVERDCCGLRVPSLIYTSEVQQ